VLRALGVSLGSAIRTVIVEGLVSLAYGLTLGVAFGVLTARLYVPFFAVSGTAGRPIPPFLPVIDWSKAEWIVVTMAVAMAAAEALVLVHMVRTRLFQALRMGDRP
jgi:putative ABC transport system permease protein